MAVAGAGGIFIGRGAGGFVDQLRGPQSRAGTRRERAVAGQPGPIIVTDATDATVTIQVSATAALGPRQVTVQTGSETATATQFYVQAPSLYPNPSYAYPGRRSRNTCTGRTRTSQRA